MGNNDDSDYNDNGEIEYKYNHGTRTMQLSEYGTHFTSLYTTDWNYIYDDSSDGNGNLTQKDNGSNIYWFYEYDVNNRLIKVILSDDSVKGDVDDIIKGEYFYDSGGLRIKKIEDGTTTIYIYSGQVILFEETFNTDNQASLDDDDYWGTREFNVLMGDKNLAKYIYEWDNIQEEWSDGSVQFHLLDHLGSRQLVVDSSGNVVTEGLEDGNIEYGTFGEYIDGIEGEYSYTGKQRDSATGLSYFNARFYDPVIGRFITMDPVKDGRNWYVYCENNPLKYVDPTGLSPDDMFNFFWNTVYSDPSMGPIQAIGGDPVAQQAMQIAAVEAGISVTDGVSTACTGAVALGTIGGNPAVVGIAVTTDAVADSANAALHYVKAIMTGSTNDMNDAHANAGGKIASRLLGKIAIDNKLAKKLTTLLAPERLGNLTDKAAKELAKQLEPLLSTLFTDLSEFSIDQVYTMLSTPYGEYPPAPGPERSPSPSPSPDE